MTSPSGKIELRLLENVPASQNAVPRLGFQVSYEGNPIVLPSPLGIRIYSQTPVLGEGMRPISSKKTSVDEPYLIPAFDGTGRNHYNGLVAEFQEESPLRRSLKIEVRVFDDGAALRYLFPESFADKQFIVEEEETEIRFAADGRVKASSNGSKIAPVPEDTLLSAIPSKTQINIPFALEFPGLPQVVIGGVSSQGAFFHHPENGTTLLTRLASRCGPCGDGPPIDPRFKLEVRLPAKFPWLALLIGLSPVKGSDRMLNNLGRSNMVER